jgi:glutaredoxin
VLFLAVMASSLDAVRLYRMDLPDHACPWGLRALQLLQERYIPFEDHCLTSTEEVEAFKLAHGVASTPQVFSGDERVGGYSDLAARLGDRAESADISYAPMAAGVGGFKGFAIYLLAMLKLMDVEAFAASFRKYDLLSQRWRLWGEGSKPQTIAAGQRVGAVAVWLGAMGMVSAGKAVFIDHLTLNCACVGGNSKTPLGVVSFAENLIMAAMGAVMLAGR